MKTSHPHFHSLYSVTNLSVSFQTSLTWTLPFHHYHDPSPLLFHGRGPNWFFYFWSLPPPTDYTYRYKIKIMTPSHSFPFVYMMQVNCLKLELKTLAVQFQSSFLSFKSYTNLSLTRFRYSNQVTTIYFGESSYGKGLHQLE